MSAAGCDAGLLQVDLVSSADLPADAETTSASYSVFLRPSITNTAQTPSSSTIPTNDSIFYGNCLDRSDCSVTFKVPGTASSDYFIHLMPLYADTDVTISATDTSNAVDFKNTQVVIDSTGYADGQYKRLEERFCYGSFCGSSPPAAAIVSDKCINKQFTVPNTSPNPLNLSGDCSN